MGEFTQNLLKLTEFPFSYSLITLLALIFGHSTNLNEPNLGEIAPLLVLMGFVATTLSICDPLGALQRIYLGKERFLSGGKLIIKGKIKPFVPPQYGPIYDEDDVIRGLIRLKIFGKSIQSIFYPIYLFAIGYPPRLVREYEINWDILNQSEISTDILGNELQKIGADELERIFKTLESLRQRAVKSKWISAEIDRITGLIYFAVVVFVFIIAIVFLPGFLSIFAKVFIDTELTKMIIIIFSIMTIGAVILMICLRMRKLKDKAETVFKYLTALETIRVDGKDFKATLENIERYLDANDWILAGYWLSRVMREYKEMYVSEARER